MRTYYIFMQEHVPYSILRWLRLIKYEVRSVKTKVIIKKSRGEVSPLLSPVEQDTIDCVYVHTVILPD